MKFGIYQFWSLVACIVISLAATGDAQSKPIDKPEPIHKQLVSGFKGSDKRFSVFVNKPFRKSVLSGALRQVWKGARPNTSLTAAKALATGKPIVIKFIFNIKGKTVLKRFKVDVKQFIPIAGRNKLKHVSEN